MTIEERMRFLRLLHELSEKSQHGRVTERLRDAIDNAIIELLKVAPVMK